MVKVNFHYIYIDGADAMVRVTVILQLEILEVSALQNKALSYCDTHLCWLETSMHGIKYGVLSTTRTERSCTTGQRNYEDWPHALLDEGPCQYK